MKWCLLLCPVLLLSCVTYQGDSNLDSEIIGFPVKPILEEYSRQPIINQIDKDFLISDEYLENSILLKKYSDKIDDWKTENGVK